MILKSTSGNVEPEVWYLTDAFPRRETTQLVEMDLHAQLNRPYQIQRDGKVLENHLLL